MALILCILACLKKKSTGNLTGFLIRAAEFAFSYLLFYGNLSADYIEQVQPQYVRQYKILEITKDYFVHYIHTQGEALAYQYLNTNIFVCTLCLYINVI